ncbi:MAG TPA: hypothetical protein VLZ53_12300, partial [Devosia sp.]|nr:hypothetical protein [Devosia sp.]
AFFDHGTSYLTAPRPPRRTLWPAPQQSPWPLDAALTISDIAAMVQLGLVPPAHAGTLAQERIAMIPLGAPAAQANAQPQTSAIPRYLHARFGKNPQIWSIAPLEARLLDVGALIYRDETSRDPLQALGVVLSSDQSGTTALLRSGFAAINQSAIVREPGRATVIRLVAPLAETPLSYGAPQQSERA